MKLSPAAAVDVICVLLFAIVGRSSHAEANSLGGVLHTAWPFLVGCLLGLVLSRSWRAPYALWTGVIVWLSTVIVGVLLRLLSGSTAQVPFVIVATVTLGLMFLGWRGLFRLVERSRTHRGDRAAA